MSRLYHGITFKPSGTGYFQHSKCKIQSAFTCSLGNGFNTHLQVTFSFSFSSFWRIFHNLRLIHTRRKQKGQRIGDKQQRKSSPSFRLFKLSESEIESVSEYVRLWEFVLIFQSKSLLVGVITTKHKSPFRFCFSFSVNGPFHSNVTLNETFYLCLFFLIYFLSLILYMTKNLQSEKIYLRTEV